MVGKLLKFMKRDQVYKKTYFKVILIFILLLAALLRLFKLGSIPPHLTSDEASLGYNAYSILKTGKDEYGSLFPIIFKSFGDYKPGLYIYLSIPFVCLFGLNEVSVRLTSALSGILAVLVIFLIVKNLLDKEDDGKGVVLALFSSFVLAISPWHILFSRGAWEANLSLTLTLLGIYFFIKSLSNQNFFYLSIFSFSLTLLTYQGAKLSTLIVVIILFFVFWEKVSKKVLSNLGVFLLSFIIAVFVSLPIFLSFYQNKVGRLKVFSIFSYPREKSDLQIFLNQGNEALNSLSYYFFHSESLNFARGIAGRWFNHFEGRFLFFEGDYQNKRHSLPNHGVLLIFDLIFLPLGFYYILRDKNKKFKSFIILWLIFSPLPAAISRDQVHSVRALNMSVPLSLISASGLYFWAANVKNMEFKKKLVFLFPSVFFLGSFVYFLDSLFIHLPIHNSQYWEYGYKQIVEAITPIQSKYKNIKIQQSFSQPYIYFLFFQKYDPTKYQKQASLVESEYKGDVGYVERLDNICFCAIDWPQNKKEHGSLVVADKIRIPDTELKDNSLNLIKQIKYLNGEVAFRIVEIR